METKDVTTTKRKQIAASSDIFEEKGNVILKMEMPGVSKDNLEIKIDNDILIIHGKKVMNQDEKANYVMKEIPEGDYYQEFTIDNTIDRNKIDAALDKGILTLTLSLKESEKPRKIQIAST